VSRRCGTCKQSRRPGVILVCASPHSEFYNGPVDPDGYCAEYQADRVERARQADWDENQGADDAERD